MGRVVAIENIEEMRRRVGIDDVELRQAIRRLRIGDRVRLTLLASPEGTGGKTLWFRITQVRGTCFQGRLAAGQGAAGLRTGTLLSFTAAHIHSIFAQRPADDD
jgi:hypothetical protein